MAAIIAIANLAQLVKLRTILLLRGPLPRILSTVGEEYVCSSSVKATLVDSSLPGTREGAHINSKCVSAILREVFGINDRAAHGVFFGH